MNTDSSIAFNDSMIMHVNDSIWLPEITESPLGYHALNRFAPKNTRLTAVAKMFKQSFKLNKCYCYTVLFAQCLDHHCNQAKFDYVLTRSMFEWNVTSNLIFVALWLIGSMRTLRCVPLSLWWQWNPKISHLIEHWYVIWYCICHFD